MSDKLVMTRTHWSGKEIRCDIHQIIDIRDFKGTAGYALLVCAANGHLSIFNIREFLKLQGVERGESWIRRRRWLFQPPGTVNSNSNANQDGKDEQARAIMREYHKASLRYVVRVLKEHGIHRGKDWVRTHRCS
ncbi:hypothetical protein SBA5_580028 [Candidatus Sulfotelmatomonas gaucii]|uniref:Uncharacterized protein n=1 Tax=Candidatus Sulfuritelmatomonas gaucii TaxID=2043161 RepID=A0A2N9LV90_9BACT|nr:hypothetical protein SBA5_580028 [Candidatus Sulfotelmatomonas gaucii]